MSSMESVLGTIDEVDGHYVATVFVNVGVPLFPMRSMYVHSMQVTRYAGGSTIRYQGRDLPIVWKSALLGMLRVWLGVATFVMPFALMWGQSVDFSNWTRWECLATYACAIAWALTLVPGHVRGDKKKQLVWLGEATGAYFDPRHDHMLGRKGVCAMMEPALRASGVEPDVASLRAGIARADAKLLGKIYAYASYEAPDSRDYAAVADEAWSKITRLTS